MLIETEPGSLNIVRNNGYDNDYEQDSSHNIKTHQFSWPAQNSITGYGNINRNQGNEWNDIEREHLSTTHQQQPESNREQRDQQIPVRHAYCITRDEFLT